MWNNYISFHALSFHANEHETCISLGISRISNVCITIKIKKKKRKKSILGRLVSALLFCGYRVHCVSA